MKRVKKKARICQIKACNNPNGPGSADVCYMIKGKPHEMRVCHEHARLLMMSRGMYNITKDRRLEPIPAAPKIQEN